MITAGPRNRTGPMGPAGKDGVNGSIGPMGNTGPSPDYEWRGTEIRFKKPSGTWGKWVDLKGKDGRAGGPGAPGAGSEGGGGHYSYKLINPDETIEIPLGQQMVVDGQVRVLGHMSVLGELVDISTRKKEQFFYTSIENDDVVVVEANRLLMYKNHLAVRGHLRVKGTLAEA